MPNSNRPCRPVLLQTMTSSLVFFLALIAWAAASQGIIENIEDYTLCCSECEREHPGTQKFNFGEAAGGWGQVKYCECLENASEEEHSSQMSRFAIWTTDASGQCLAGEVVDVGGADDEMGATPPPPLDTWTPPTPPPMTKERFTEDMMRIVMDLDKSPKDGIVTKEEYDNSNQGEIVKWNVILELSDANCDGSISEQEFRDYASIFWDISKTLDVDFKELDQDHNEFITKEEVGDDELWEALADKDGALEDMSQNPVFTDKSKDGNIDQNEFLIFMVGRTIDCASPSVTPEE